MAARLSISNVPNIRVATPPLDRRSPKLHNANLQTKAPLASLRAKPKTWKAVHDGLQPKDQDGQLSEPEFLCTMVRTPRV